MLGWRRPKATVTGCGSLPHMVAQGHRVTICVEKTRGGGAHHEADVAAMAAPNWWSGAASGAQEGPRELAMHARMVKVVRGREEKKGVDVGASKWRREKEERGAWHCDRQCREACSGPQPSGAGGTVVVKQGRVVGRG
jgi:hypothetical protein